MIVSIEPPRSKGDYLIYEGMPTVHLHLSNGVVEDTPLGSKQLHNLIKNESANIKKQIKSLEDKFVRVRRQGGVDYPLRHI